MKYKEKIKIETEMVNQRIIKGAQKRRNSKRNVTGNGGGGNVQGAAGARRNQRYNDAVDGGVNNGNSIVADTERSPRHNDACNDGANSNDDANVNESIDVADGKVISARRGPRHYAAENGGINNDNSAFAVNFIDTRRKLSRTVTAYVNDSNGGRRNADNNFNNNANGNEAIIFSQNIQINNSHLHECHIL